MLNKRSSKFSLAAEQESIQSLLRSENQSLKKKNDDLAKALADTRIEQQKLRENSIELHAENQSLKKKNDNLAKALADTRIEQQKLRENSLELHERLYSTDVQRIKFKEFVKTLSLDMRTYVQNFFSLTEQMTNMLNRINIALQSPESLNQLISDPRSANSSMHSNHNNKTMAVMPMVSGHTILSPKINLPRITVKQLTEMVNNVSNDINNSMEADEDEFTNNVSSNNEDLSQSNSGINEVPNQRLETMEEEDEDDVQSNLSTSQPFLSGVFKDIKVYISPMSPQHIIKFKNKSHHKQAHKSFSQSANSSSVRSPENASASLIRRNAEVSRPSTSTMNNSNNEIDLKDTINHLSGNINSETKMNTEDPMEGTSGLWTTMQDVTPFKPIPNETSTPYTPLIEASSSTGEPKTPRRPSRNVSKRKRTTRISSRSRTMSSNLSSCSVKLQRMPSSTLKAYVSSNSYVSPEKSTYKEQSDSPIVSEKSRRSSQFEDKRRKRSRSDSCSSSSLTRRPRNVKPVVYTEPLLNKKLRR